MQHPFYPRNPYLKNTTDVEYDPNLDLRKQSEFQKSVNSWVDETQAIGGGLVALGANALKNTGVENKLVNKASDWGLDVYQRNMEEAQAGAQAPKVARVEDIHSFGDAMDWVAYQLPKGILNVGTAFTGAGLGAAIGKQAVKAGVKGTLKREVGEQVGKHAVSDSAKALAAAEARKTMMRGAVVGGTVTAFGMEGGTAFGEQVHAGAAPEDAVASATVVGGINAALEFLPLYGVAKKIGMGDFAKQEFKQIFKQDKALGKAAVELARRVAGAGAVGVAAEGATEGLQELVNIAGKRWATQSELFAKLSDEEKSQILNATAAGGLVGGAVGGTGGAFVGPKTTQDNTTTDPAAPPADGPTAPPTNGPIVPVPPTDGGPAIYGEVTPNTPSLYNGPIDGESWPANELSAEKERNAITLAESQARLENLTKQLQQFDDALNTTEDPAEAESLKAQRNLLEEELIKEQEFQLEYGPRPQLRETRESTQTQTGVQPDLPGLGQEELNLNPAPEQTEMDFEFGRIEENSRKQPYASFKNAEVAAERLKKSGKLEQYDIIEQPGENGTQFAIRDLGPKPKPFNTDFDIPFDVLEEKEPNRKATFFYQDQDGNLIDEERGLSDFELDQRELEQRGQGSFFEPRTKAKSDELKVMSYGQARRMAREAGFKNAQVVPHGDGYILRGWQDEYVPSPAKPRATEPSGIKKFDTIGQAARKIMRRQKVDGFSPALYDELGIDNTTPGFKSIKRKEGGLTHEDLAMALHEAGYDIADPYADGVQSHNDVVERIRDELRGERARVYSSAVSPDEMVNLLGLNKAPPLPEFRDTYPDMAEDIGHQDRVAREGTQAWQDFETLFGERAAQDKAFELQQKYDVPEFEPLPYEALMDLKDEVAARAKPEPDIFFSKPKQETEYRSISKEQALNELNSFFGKGFVKRLLDTGLLHINDKEHWSKRSGFWHQGRIQINTQYLAKEGTAASLLLHESSHAGLNVLLGGKLHEYMRDIAKLIERKDPLALQAAILAKTQAEQTAAEQGRALSKRELIEETIAYYIELTEESRQSNGVVRRMLNDAKAGFSQTTFGKVLRGLGLGVEMNGQVLSALAKRGLKETVATAEFLEWANKQSLDKVKEARVYLGLPAEGAVATAQRFVGDGTDPLAVKDAYDATGLVQLGGEWVGAFRDSDFFLKQGISRATAKTLKDILEAPKYFAANPKAADMPVEFTPHLRELSKVVDGKLYLNSRFDNESIGKLRETILNELREIGRKESPNLNQESALDLPNVFALRDALKANEAAGPAKADPVMTGKINQILEDPIKARQLEQALKVSKFASQMSLFGADNPQAKQYFDNALFVHNELIKQAGLDETFLRKDSTTVPQEGIFPFSPDVLGLLIKDGQGTAQDDNATDTKSVTIQGQPVTIMADVQEGFHVKLSYTADFSKFTDPTAAIQAIAKELDLYGKQLTKEIENPQFEIFPDGFAAPGHKLMADLSKIDKWRTPNPEQAKQSDGIMYSMPKRLWRYGLENTIVSNPQSKGTPEQWQAVLSKQTKKEELADSGLQEYLQQARDEGRKVTKDELLEFVRNGGVKLDEVSFPEQFTPKYDAYQLPNGENYRELLLTLPNNATSILSPEDKKFYEIAQNNGRGLDPADAAAYGKWVTGQWPRVNNEVENNTYYSSHWDTPNVLAHIRFNERVLNGKRTLFIEEVQSDWHQQGRKEGYVIRTELTDKEKTRLAELEAKIGDRYWTPEQIEATLTTEEQYEYMDLFRRNSGELTSGVPNAPFKSAWSTLGVKRAIKWAIDNGFEQVAWTGGRIQADRYGLARHVNEIAVDSIIDNDRTVRVDMQRGGTINLLVNKDGVIRSYLGTTEFDNKKLDEVIGTELAAKIMAVEGPTAFNGNDLTLGGEGMIGFYDKILPAEMNKYLKRFGTKAQPMNLEEGQVWTFDVTPDLVNEAESGMPMYSKANRVPPELAKQLDAGETITLYRAMSLIDGKLYPPMSAKMTDASGKLVLREPEPVGEWQQSEEKPDLVPTEGRNKGMFPLKKPGGGTTWALYAPYFHASPLPLNDQFTAAYLNDGVNRPQIVTVEVEVPASEKDSAYTAQGSVKSTGSNKWNAGVVASKIPGGREVFLSRYLKIKRIVPEAEVAEKIAAIANEHRLQIPENVVTPQLREALEKQGVKIAPKGTKGQDILYSFAGRKAGLSTKDRQDLRVTLEELKAAAKELDETPTGIYSRLFELDQLEAAGNLTPELAQERDTLNATQTRVKELADLVWKHENKLQTLIEGRLKKSNYFDFHVHNLLEVAEYLTQTPTLGKADVAERMLFKEGKKAEEVLNETGWWYGPDKKWKYEINDRDAALIKLPIDSTSLPIKEVLAHDKLFAIYPELALVEVVMNNQLTEKQNGLFNPINFRIELNPTSTKPHLNTILHELQHAIQLIEDFGQGSSSEIVAEYKEQYKADFAAKKRGAMAFQKDVLGGKTLRDFVRTANTVRSLHGPNSQQAFDADMALLDAQVKLDEAYAKNPELHAEYEASRWAMEHSSDYDLYLATWGEQEARLVEIRREMNDEERRTTKPWKQYDSKLPRFIINHIAEDGTIQHSDYGWNKKSLNEGAESNVFDGLFSTASRIQDVKRYMWADPTDPDSMFDLGETQRWYVNYVDMFSTIEHKDEGIKDAYDLMESKKGAKLDEINRLFTKPLVELVGKTGLKVEQVNDWLAARHIVLDNVNRQMAMRASYQFARDLLPKLQDVDRKAMMQEMGKIRKAMTGTKNTAPTLTKEQGREEMFKLVEYYMPKEKLSRDPKLGGAYRQVNRWKWQHFKEHASGMFMPELDANGNPLINGSLKNRANQPDAYQIYKQYEQDVNMQAVAAKMDQLTKHQLELLLEGGLITQSEFNALLNDKKAYVPLRREAFDYESHFDFMREGKGPGKGVSTRFGSDELNMKPVHIIQNALARAHGSASAAQRNIANNYLYEQVVAHPDAWQNWFEVLEDNYRTRMDKFGFAQRGKSAQLDPEDIVLLRKGKRLIIKPIEANERAKVFAAAVNKQGATNIGAVGKLFRAVNTFVRFTAISASVPFLLTNAVRDPLTAAYNMQASEAGQYTKEIFGTYKTAFKALYQTFYKEQRIPGDPLTQMIEDWEQAGGRISFVESLKEMDNSWQSFDAMVKARKVPPAKVMLNLFNKIESANIAIENVMRLATFHVLKNKPGITKERAARIAKDLTTNFSRKGFNSSTMGTFYLFFNATVQGNAQVINNLLKSSKLRKMVAGTVGAALLMDIMGRALAEMDGDDENEWDKIPAYEKERNIILPFKFGDNYIKIPAPWVYNVVWRMGGLIGETTAGVRSAGEATADLVGMSLTTMNPMGGATIAQGLSPTAFDPFIQVLENKDFAGNPLRPVNFPGAGSKPDSELYWQSTPEWAKGIARTLNKATGGNAAESGWIDISPTSISNLVDFLGAGLLNFAKDVGNVPLKVAANDLTIKDIPIIKQYATRPSSSVSTGLYYDNVAKVLGAEKAVKAYSEGINRNPEMVRKLKDERAAELRLVNHTKDVERQLKSLRTRMRAAQGRGDTARAEELKKRIEAVQTRYNTTYAQRVKS